MSSGPFELAPEVSQVSASPISGGSARTGGRTLRNVFAEMAYVNLVQPLVAAARGRAPTAPKEGRHGVPISDSGTLKHAIAVLLSHAGARYFARPARRLPYLDTVFTLANPAALPASLP